MTLKLRCATNALGSGIITEDRSTESTSSGIPLTLLNSWISHLKLNPKGSSGSSQTTMRFLLDPRKNHFSTAEQSYGLLIMLNLNPLSCPRVLSLVPPFLHSCPKRGPLFSVSHQIKRKAGPQSLRFCYLNFC